MTNDTAGLEQAGLRLDIEVQPGGVVATVTLDRPQRRNAMTPSMWRGLARIGASLPPEVRVVLVRGAGPSFSAGLDRRLLAAGGVPGEEGLPGPADPALEDWIATVQEGFTWLRRPDFVSIAAVQGHAIGAGFQLALACDIRLLADDAKLCMKEPAFGMVPDLTGTKPLVDIVGLPRAMELCLTTRTIDASEAHALRLAELVVPRVELDAAVADLVAALLATDEAAARSTKALLQQAQHNTLVEQAAAERRAQAELLGSRAGLAGRRTTATTGPTGDTGHTAPPGETGDTGQASDAGDTAPTGPPGGTGPTAPAGDGRPTGQRFATG